MVVEEQPTGAESGLEGSPHVVLGHACTIDVDGLVEGDAHEAEGRALHVLFEHEHADRLTLHEQVVGNLTDDGRLTDARACGDRHQLGLSKPTGELVQVGPWVRDGGSGVLPEDFLQQVLTRHDAVRSESLGVPDGTDDLLALALHEAVVGVLEGERGDLGLTWGEQLSTLRHSGPTGLVHVEHEDDFLEGFEPVEGLLDGLLGTLSAVRDGHDRPLVTLELTHGEGINLTLCNDQLLPALAPQVLPVEREGLLEVAEDGEVLVGEADLLGHHVALGIAVVSDLYGLVAQLVEGVPELATGLLGETTLCQGTELTADQ